ncbi:MAG: UMP kinase [Candidatus Diapherotrites archaeon]
MFDMFKMFEQNAENAGQGQDQYPAQLEAERIFVVSVGGSALIKDKVNFNLLAKIANSISNLKKEGFKFAAVVGGGKIARDYLASAKLLGTTNNFLLDEMAINVTRINAAMLIHALDEAHPEVQTRIYSSKDIINSGKIPVYGGLIPGFTTDTVAALLSEFLEGTFVNLSNQDGIYTSDPKEDSSAKLISKMNHDRLLRLMFRTDTRLPGANVIIDAVTCMILNRSKIKAMVLNATDPENFESALRGNDFTGTLIETKEE